MKVKPKTAKKPGGACQVISDSLCQVSMGYTLHLTGTLSKEIFKDKLFCVLSISLLS